MSSNEMKDNSSGEIYCNKCKTPLKSCKLKLSCNHYLCNSCLSRDLLINNFKDIIKSDGEVTIDCKCGGGTINLSLDQISKCLDNLNEIRVQKMCQKHNKALLYYCNDCRIWLCEECKDVFHSEYFHKTHQISSNGEKLKTSKCFYHRNEIKDHICKDCNELICPLCVTDSIHAQHSTFTILDYKKTVKDKKHELKYKKYSELEKFISDKEVDTLKNFNEESDKYKNLVDKGIEILNNLKDNYVKNAEKYMNIIKYKFKIMKKSYSNYYEVLEDDKCNMSSFDFISQIKEELQNIIYNKSDKLEELNKAINNLPNIRKEEANSNELNKNPNIVDNNMNLYTIDLSFKKKKYKKLTSFDIPYPITTINYNNKNAVFIIGTSSGKILMFKDKEIPLKDEYIEIDEHPSSIKIIKQLIYQEKECFVTGSDKKLIVWEFENDAKNEQNDNNINNNNYNKLSSQRTDDTSNRFQNKNNQKEKVNIKVKKIKILEDMFNGSLLDLCELDNGKIASSFNDNTIILWNIPNKSKSNNERTSYTNSNFNKNNNFNNTNNNFNTNCNDENIILKDKVNYETSLIELDSDYLVSGSGDGRCKLWDLNKKSILRFYIGHQGYVNCLLKINETKFISGGSDSKIIIWNKDNQNHKMLLGHTETIQSLCKINDNKIISSSNDRCLKIWDLNDLACIYTFKNCHKSAIYGLAILDKKFISGGNDKTLKFFELENNDKNEDNEFDENYEFSQ